MITSCVDERSECKRIADDASKMLRRHQNWGATLPWEEHGGYLLTGHAVSGVKATRISFGLSYMNKRLRLRTRLRRERHGPKEGPRNED